MTYTPERIRLRRAFDAIKAAGGMTVTGMCCPDCSLAALIDRGADPDTTIAFHHAQSVALAWPRKVGGRMVEPLHIYHGGNSRMVCEALENEGLRVEWAGNDDEAIVVLPDLLN